MIDTHQSRQFDERRLWLETVRRQFQTLEIQNEDTAQEIAESLAVFCQQQAYMPEQTLSLLIARSFCVTGCSDAAGQILSRDRMHGRHTESWLEVLSADYPFPELYPLFASRVLRPQHLSSAGTLWVIDLDKVRLTAVDRCELILFQTVRVLIEKVSNVWKKTSGQGTLGIKGLFHFCGQRNSQLLLNHVHAVLEHCAQKNDWNHTPSVLLLGKTREQT